jgi:hypothetical protein
VLKLFNEPLHVPGFNHGTFMVLIPLACPQFPLEMIHGNVVGCMFGARKGISHNQGL